MITFPNCKINLGLSVLGPRPDGFHDIETFFYPLPFRDALEIIPASEFGFSATGYPIGGEAEDNLCIRAWRLIKNDFPGISPVKIHLHKAVPIGAGLGGGSADGAYALLLLNEMFRLQLPTKKLKDYALSLGSDSPFFLLNKPSLAKGRGELLQEIALDLSQYAIILVSPLIHINTGWAFSSIDTGNTDLTGKTGRLLSAIEQPISAWKNELINDFERPVFDLYPEIKEIRDSMYEQGAVYSAMTGTGSTIFGLFPKNVRPHFSTSYKVYEA